MHFNPPDFLAVLLGTYISYLLMTPYLICPVGAQHPRQLSLFDVDTTCEPNSVFTLKEIQVCFRHKHNFYSFTCIINCLPDCGNALLCLSVPGPRVHNERHLQRHRSLRRISRVRLQEGVQAQGKKTRYKPIWVCHAGLPSINQKYRL